MHGHRGRCRVEHVGRRDDTQRLALRAVQVFGQVFDPWVVEGIARVVREHAFLVVVGLVAGHIVGHARCGIGDQTVQRRGHHHAGEGRAVHCQQLLGFALGIAAADDAGSRAVRRTHAVAEQDDDVLDLAATAFECCDFKIAKRFDRLSIALFGPDAELVQARLQVGISALRDHGGIDTSRQAQTAADAAAGARF